MKEKNEPECEGAVRITKYKSELEEVRTCLLDTSTCKKVLMQGEGGKSRKTKKTSGEKY